MFAHVTKSFVNDTEPKGSLIPVSSLHEDLKMYSLIYKKPCYIFVTKNKYKSLQFTLNNVLKTKDTENTLSDMVLRAADEVDWVKTINNKDHCSIDGKVQTVMADGELRFGGNRSIIQDFKIITKKEDVDLEKFIDYCKTKELDMEHGLIKEAFKQASENHFLKTRAVLAVLTGRILTSKPCQFTSIDQASASVAGGVAGKMLANIKVTLNPSISVNRDSKTSLAVLENTVLAYRLKELYIKRSGKFDVVYLPDQKGGFGKEFEEDGGDYGAQSPPELRQDMFCTYFELLGELKDLLCDLLQILQTTLQDREAFIVLENVLDLLCEDPNLCNLKEDSFREAVKDIDRQIKTLPNETRSQIFCAIHLIVSAINEMTDSCVSTLSCCSPKELKALQFLVNHMTVEPVCLRDQVLAALTDEEVFRRAQHLFEQCDVTLTKDVDKLTIKNQPGNLPLVLSIAVTGLASLV